MKNTWKHRTLGELLKIQNGYAFDSKSFQVNEGVPLIRIRDLKNGIGTETRFSGKFDPTYLVNAGDLLVGMDGEFGCYQWRGEQALLNQRVCKLAGFTSDLWPKFLFYGVNSYLKEIEELTGFTTVKHLSSKQIASIRFPVPPLSEQKRIVAILDEAFAGIDTAIANTKKNVANARELFEDCLHNIVADKAPLGSLVEIRTGKLDANAAVEGGEFPFFTCSREIYTINEFAFDCEAILLAGNNAVGDFNVKHYKGKFNAYQRTYVITVNAEKRISYRFLYFQMLKSLKQFKAQSVGVGTKFLKLGMIKNMEIALPPIQEQGQIVSKIDCLLEDTERLEAIYQQKLDSLAELKQAILHKAFSGELTAHPEKALPEAAE